MRKLAFLTWKISLAIIFTLITCEHAEAIDKLDDATLAQRRCFNTISASPTQWIDESAPVSTSRTARGPICNMDPNGEPYYTQSYNTTWNGQNARVDRGICNGTFPIIRVNIPNERNYIYILGTNTVDGAYNQNAFLWNQASNLCLGASAKQFRGDWHLPTRTQKAYFRFISDARSGLAQPLASFHRNEAAMEEVYATFVEESDAGSTRQCYENSMTGFVFSSRFYVASIFGLTDKDFLLNAERASNGQMVVQGQDEAVQVLVKYVMQMPIYQDAGQDQKMRDHLSRTITLKQATNIKQKFKAAGAGNIQQGYANVRDYLLNNGDGLDWTAVFSDANFRKTLTDRSALVEAGSQMASINRPRDQGGGIPVFCVSEKAKR